MSNRFEIRVSVLDDEERNLYTVHLDYDMPEDDLDLEDTLMYVSSDIGATLKPYLGK